MTKHVTKSSDIYTLMEHNGQFEEDNDIYREEMAWGIFLLG